MKPIISLFQTPNGYYFFDANKDEVVSIGEEAFEYLNMLLSSDEPDVLSMPNELLRLKEQGYLKTESSVSKIQHIYSNNLDFYLNRKLSYVILQLTQDCNLRCKYCIYSEEHNSFQRSHSKKNMSWDTIKIALKFLKDHSVDSHETRIGFYGGEPLLEFELLQKTVSYSKEFFAGKELAFNMTTNGTLLTDEIILFCEEHEFSMMISLDGPKEINDFNRVFEDGTGTFDTVAERIERIKEIAPNYLPKVGISMVINPENDFDCINELCMDDSEFRKLTVQPSLVDRNYGGEEVEFSRQYIWKNEYQHFLALLSHYNKCSSDAVSPIAAIWMKKIIDDYPKIDNASALHETDAPSGPCVPGKMRLFINVDGMFYPCERVSEMSEAMCIGSLKDGFNHRAAQNMLNVGVLTESECKKCWCFRHCGTCVKKADDGSNALSKNVKLSNCDEMLSSAYSKIQQYLLLKEIPLFYPKQIRGDK